MYSLWFFVLFIYTFGSCSVIIPEELPSLLSVAYSNIPPVKKGTDSRVGFGFAFGNHADFQLMFELGPQTNTKSLTGSSSSNAKRQVSPQDSKKLSKTREKLSQSDAGNYLQNWAQKMKYPSNIPPSAVNYPSLEVPNLEDSVVELIKNSKGEYEIHQPKPSHVSQDILDDLRQLFEEKKGETNKVDKKNKDKRSKAEVKKITEDLSNVDID